MATREKVRLLASVPLFSELSRRELEAVAGAAKEVTHAAGDVLARQGDRGVGFFLITDGTANVTVGDHQRARLGPGDYFGEIALLDEGPRSATVTAASDIKMLGLTAWVFKGLVEQNPSIALKLLKVLAQRIRDQAEEPTH